MGNVRGGGKGGGKGGGREGDLSPSKACHLPEMITEISTACMEKRR